ncbi:CoA transferase [Actinocorallia longicatena]|uniref:CoA transferase n=1 Tax=Actinocorallia longicatena TaxID=111803 RepID=A0ABP6QAQ1_9ACTN
MKEEAVSRWAASGAMSLTGRPGAPGLGPPGPLVAALDALASPFPGLDPLVLLTERAALAGLTRQGATSCGGGTRLLRARDAWIAVSLPRAGDVEALPAWLEGAVPGDGAEPPWEAVAAAVAGRTGEALLERAELLGLAVGVLPGRRPLRPAVVRSRLGDAPPRDDLRGLRVVDLTSLWAGPLCGDLLGRRGAEVVKVESPVRPDGTRRGSPAVFDLINGGKRSVALDFSTREGVTALRALLRSADVVLEASRPRALEQAGVRAAEIVAEGGPSVWVSITGHGRERPMRVGFGDDAAVAGGLVVRDAAGPCFCADAIADPATGLTAAHACLEALRSGGRWLLDIAMSAVAASLAGPSLPVFPGLTCGPLRARSPRAPSRPLGADTAAVLAATAGAG